MSARENLVGDNKKLCDITNYCGLSVFSDLTLDDLVHSTIEEVVVNKLIRTIPSTTENLFGWLLSVGFKTDFLRACGVRGTLDYFVHQSPVEVLQVLIGRICAKFECAGSHYLPKDERNFPAQLKLSSVNTVTKESSYNFLLCGLADNNDLDFAANHILSKMGVNGSNLNNAVYHGTSWYNATSIMTEIDPHASGRKQSDFGVYNFYVSNNLNLAIHWACRNHQPALCIFTPPIDYVDTIDSHKKRFFENANSNWSQFVSFCRNSDFYEVRNSIQNYSIICGPLLKNTFGEATPISINGVLPIQWAIRESLVDQFHGFLHTIVVFEEGYVPSSLRYD